MAGANGRINLRNLKLLVVEDNPQSMEIIAQVLVGFGVTHAHKCETAEDARIALGKQVFDMIMVDGELKCEDGFAFTRRVRSQPSDPNFSAPIVIISGCPTSQKVLTARDSGAHFVIAKPLVPRTLLARMSWIAGNNRQFVISDGFRGPDRRFRKERLPPGMEDRRAAAFKLVENAQRELSQNEIDSLF